jgi:ABC-type amino acid transport substrate-binding protein
MQLFAAHLGVRYEFVGTSWQNLVPDLTGKVVKPRGEDVDVVGETAVRGDVIASGFTILPWRTKVVEFSTETFPSGVWLLSRADSALQPISATDDILKDIQEVKKQLKGMSVLGLKDSCLDPDLYLLEETGAEIELFPQDRDLNEMIPAIIARLANATLMDVPVALIALERWPGEIKVVGPLSPTQGMACAFPTTSPRLRQAFEEFFRQCKADGTYHRLVNRYYPSVSTYYPHFLEN